MHNNDPKIVLVPKKSAIFASNERISCNCNIHIVILLTLGRYKLRFIKYHSYETIRWKERDFKERLPISCSYRFAFFFMFPGAKRWSGQPTHHSSDLLDTLFRRSWDNKNEAKMFPNSLILCGAVKSFLQYCTKC